MFAIDGRKTWLVYNYLRPQETFDSVDYEGCIRTILGVGPSFSIEIIAKEDWTARRMIADRFRARRIFLCGDAAHIGVPGAGCGMNARIADAMNLLWMLADGLKGWAPTAILNCYEREHMPITDQMSRYAMNTSTALAKQGGIVPDDIEEPRAEGNAAQARLPRILRHRRGPDLLRWPQLQVVLRNFSNLGLLPSTSAAVCDLRLYMLHRP